MSMTRVSSSNSSNCSHSHHPSLSSSSTSLKLLIFLGFGISMLVFHQVLLVARYHNHHHRYDDANTAALLASMLSSAWSLSSLSASSSPKDVRMSNPVEYYASNNTIAAAATVAQHDDSNGTGGPFDNRQHSPLTTSPPLQPPRNNNMVEDTFQFDLKKSPPFAIFYNVYIHKGNNNNNNKNNAMTANEQEERQVNKARHNRARRIFQEQMKTVGTSYANSLSQTQGKPVTVYFNTIGDATAINASFVHDICTMQYNFTCRHLHHYDTAFEDVTLQHLYEFCHVVHLHHHRHPNNDSNNIEDYEDEGEDENENDLRVVYMHNKGSFNKARYQNDNRRIFTQTVTSRACLLQSSSSTTTSLRKQEQQDCNVCGHLFQPVWGPFFGGNFWVASCSYIRRLIPPKLINQTMTEKLIPALHKMQQEGKLIVTNLLPVVGPFALGTGRYSHEHWVAGHGTLRPCDVVIVQEEEERVKDATTVVAERTHMKTTTTTTTRQILAPREHINSTNWHGLKQTWTTRVLRNKHLRLREYFLLPGLLFRLHVLYPQQGPPPSDSWMWRWFPDGKLWKDALEKYGGILPAINAVTARLIKNTTTTTSRA